MTIVESASETHTDRPEPPAIRLSGVSKSFRLSSGAHFRAVNDVSLTIEKGEFVAVVGPSGHGKSTLLNIIGGFIAPDEGIVESHGAPVTSPGADRGVLFQRDTLFNWMRVSANVEYGMKACGVPKDLRRERATRLLEIVGLTPFAKAWPRQLSGGMRRRAAIAAVFANEPNVLLMDEPFTGLDFARRNKLYEVLQELWQRSRNTVYCVTHDLEEALSLATRVIVVLNGRIAMDEKLALPFPRQPEHLISAEINDLRVHVHHLLESALDEGGSSRD